MEQLAAKDKIGVFESLGCKLVNTYSEQLLFAITTAINERLGENRIAKCIEDMKNAILCEIFEKVLFSSDKIKEDEIIFDTVDKVKSEINDYDISSIKTTDEFGAKKKIENDDDDAECVAKFLFKNKLWLATYYYLFLSDGTIYKRADDDTYKKECTLKLPFYLKKTVLFAHGYVDSEDFDEFLSKIIKYFQKNETFTFEHSMFFKELGKIKSDSLEKTMIIATQTKLSNKEKLLQAKEKHLTELEEYLKIKQSKLETNSQNLQKEKDVFELLKQNFKSFLSETKK